VDTVVLLHGLGRSERSMRHLASRLEEAGFEAHAIGYDSTQKEPAALALDLEQELAGCCRDGTGPESLPNQLPAADFELGVIAGTRTVNPLGSWLIPAADDGTVSVASTQLEGMADFVTLPVTHTFILRSREVARQTLAFLTLGRFDHPQVAKPRCGIFWTL
jgi:hypothetical protein